MNGVPLGTRYDMEAEYKFDVLMSPEHRHNPYLRHAFSITLFSTNKVYLTAHSVH
jgi:hypothetical protein